MKFSFAKPARKFTQTRLLIASRNEGKVQEIKELLSEFNVQVVSASSLNIEEPEETGRTFEENALLKAHYYCKASNLPALADDSGLCVEALGGDPGVYSARWAGDTKDFSLAINKVKEELSSRNALESPKASFKCALALAWPDEYEVSFEGECKGHLTFPPQGTHGFGYDPIFIPNGYDQTFAQIHAEEKQRISHRAKAFRSLVEACFKP